MVFPSTSTIVTMLVVYGLLFAALRRPWTTLALSVYLIGFVLLSSFLKQAYLGVAMTLADMHFFLLRPVENFHLFLNYPVLGVSLLAVVGGFILIVAVGAKFERPLHLFARPRLGGWLRVATAAASLTVGASAILIASPESHARVNDGDAYVAFLSMYEQQHPTGLIGRLNVFFNNRSFEASLPPKQVQSRFLNEGTDEAVTGETRPDIFLILEESTFDPNIIRACKPIYCDNEMLHPLKVAKRTQQGPLLVHTTGGGTWLAEFAVLSGFDWRVFGRGGAYAPVSLAPRLHASLPIRLRELGYRTIAIYPTDGNFLSATAAYGNYGFEEFYDARQLKLPHEWGDIPDSMVFNRAMERIAQKDDPRPVFIFALTIRNHGPHGDSPKKVMPAFAKAVPMTSVYLADYLGRMRDSSQDFVAAAKQWLDSPRPRVIAWFGDHQPEAAWDFTEHPNLLDPNRVAKNASGKQLQYLTHYQMSANFGERAKIASTDALDISYLSAQLVAFAQLPLDRHASTAKEVAHACGGLMIDCADHTLINDYLSFRVHDLGAVQ